MQLSNSQTASQALHISHHLPVHPQIQNVHMVDWCRLNQREQGPTLMQLLTTITLLNIKPTPLKHNHKLRLRSVIHTSPLNSSKVLSILRHTAMLRTRFRDIRPSSNNRRHLRSSNSPSMLNRNNIRNTWPILPLVAIEGLYTRIQMANCHREERALNLPIIHPELTSRQHNCPPAHRLIRM